MSAGGSSRLATVLRWPFMRWRNMAATGVVLLVLIVAQGKVNSALGGDEPKAAALGSPTQLGGAPSTTQPDPSETTEPSDTTPSSSIATATVSSSSTNTTSSPTSTATPAPEVPAAVAQGPAEQVAKAFIAAWSSTGDAARWHEQVATLATPAFAGDLNSTDPERVPVSQVGSMTSSVSTNDGLQTVTFDTDAGPIAVQVTNTGPAWLVSQVNPVDQPPGAPDLDLSSLDGSS
jgi:hypothetical protein